VVIFLQTKDNIERHLRIILDSIDEGIHVIDENTVTVIYNNRMAELEDMNKDFVIGRKLLDVFPSLTQDTSTLLRALNKKEIIKDKQQDYLNNSGEKITTINTTIPIKLEDGRIWALEVAKDITEIKNLYYRINSLQERLYSNNKEINSEKKFYTFNDIIGQDSNLKEIINYARQAAATDSSILIYGKTGTGKELFAQSIHSASKRKEKPFIAQNCAALPENLLEGILFGTRKGGFTGAVNRKGLFEQANGGTLLLDEINSMSLGLQAKLLRVLQEGKVRPVGGKDEIEIDVRIITTINTPPVQAIKEGNLREDLYYRLAVVLLNLPLLTDREGDIILLSKYFIDKFNNKFNKKVKGLNKIVQNIFYRYDWPGNVRQLEHVIEGAMNIINEDEYIKEEHIRPFLISIDDRNDNSLRKVSSSLPDRLGDFEKRIILETLEKTEGNISKAARKLGIKRQSLQYRLNKYGINIYS
jgi:arginine utilization regulatory protein